MASCKKRISCEYVLSLSQDEADTLIALLGMVSGSHINSPRKHCDSIYDALKESGVGLNMSVVDLVEDEISFKDYQ